LAAFKRALNSMGVRNFSGSMPKIRDLFVLQISDYNGNQKLQSIAMSICYFK
jgi:hypothetical protein